MATYIVTVEQTVRETYEIEVEAQDEAGARALVEAEIEHGLNDADKIGDDIDDCEITYVERDDVED